MQFGVDGIIFSLFRFYEVDIVIFLCFDIILYIVFYGAENLPVLYFLGLEKHKIFYCVFGILAF